MPRLLLFQKVCVGFVYQCGRLEGVAVTLVSQIPRFRLWFGHYRFGALEWCWRSLTYWKRQLSCEPNRRNAASSSPDAELQAQGGPLCDTTF
jgi:uncharacterized membrane protein YeiB